MLLKLNNSSGKCHARAPDPEGHPRDNMPYFIIGGVAPEEESFAQKERRGNSQFVNLDGDFDRIRLIDQTQDDGRRVRKGAPNVGRSLLPDHIPTKLEREPWNLRLLPLLDVERYWGGNLLVPQQFKDILEELEPDVHQFWPMEIYVKGEQVDLKYWFIACNRISALSREHCYPPLHERGFWRPSPIGKRENDRVAFSKAAIGDRHAWVDKHFSDRYFSNTFAERLQKLDLTGLRFSKNEEV